MICNCYLGQSIQEWTKRNLWKRAFKNFHLVHSWHTEAATRGVLLKKVFLEISRNSQENTCARVSFFNKLDICDTLNWVHDMRKLFHPLLFQNKGEILLLSRYKKNEIRRYLWWLIYYTINNLETSTFKIKLRIKNRSFCFKIEPWFSNWTLLWISKFNLKMESHSQN